MRDADDPKAARYVPCARCGHAAMVHVEGGCFPSCSCSAFVEHAPPAKPTGLEPRLSLLPWRALLVVARQMAAGLRDGRKPHCWREDKTLTRAGYLDKALRHIVAHVNGEQLDDTGQPHLAAAAADLLIALELA